MEQPQWVIELNNRVMNMTTQEKDAFLKTLPTLPSSN